MKLLESMIEKSGIVVRIITLLEGVSKSLLSMGEHNLEMTKRYLQLFEAYRDVQVQLANQQGVNAELYGMLIQLASSLKERGLDVSFPDLEHEVAQKKSGDPGAKN